MPQLVASEPPPDDYYADNLKTLIGGVLEQYGDLVNHRERAFAERLLALPDPSIRLLARLIGRKGPWIRVDSLDYREVPNTDHALRRLAAEGFVAGCDPAPADRLLKLLTVAEIGTAFPRVAKRVPKTDYVDHVVARYPDAVVRARIAARHPWVRVAVEAELFVFRLLFYGDAHQDLTSFVMRDLGLTRFEGYDLARERRLFPDRATLDRYIELIALGEHVAALGDRPAPALAEGVLPALWERFDQRALERKRSRILNRLGRGLERVGAFDLALACYGRSTLAPSRERRARILQRLGDRRAVDGLRKAMRERPRSALERDFAQRFGRVRRRGDLHISEVALRGATPPYIEGAALALLTANRGVGWHLENQLPMALFGLAYWDWVFAPVEGMFVNAFQSAPLDLFWPDFFTTRAARCADPLALPAGALREKMLATAVAKRGITNRLIAWDRLGHGSLVTLLDTLGERTVRTLLKIVREDLDRARTGFPDLTLLYGAGRFEFVEVKGPGDQLQNNQILWIRALEAHGLPVRVLRFR